MEKHERAWLRRIRKKRGYKTQKDLAEVVGMSQTHYSNIENGNRMARGDQALKIAIVLEIPLERFYEQYIIEWRQEWEVRKNANKS